MGIGLGLLRLSPSHFWSMTPREFVAALGDGVDGNAGAPARADFESLMARFPDNKEG